MRALIKLLLLLIWLPLIIAITTLPYLIKWEAGRRWCSWLAFLVTNRILGLRVHVRGQLSAHRPLLLVSNHSSYIDILVMGCKLPVAFTPKSELRRWPVIGYCCKLSGCVFVDRSRSAAQHNQREIAQAMQKGRVICVYAEGTTNNGTDIKPFKSSLFSLAVGGHDVRIQPCALSYTHINGTPTDAASRARIAWYDDMTLLPHLWRLLKLRCIDAQLTLLPLQDASDDRKALCRESEAMIKQELEQ